MSQKKLIKSVSILMIVSIFSRILGFVRDILVASAFGSNYITDAYYVAVSVPEVVFGIIGLAISTTFIPIFSEVLTKEGKKQMFLFSNNINNILAILSLIIFIIGMFCTESIVKMIAPSFNSETLKLAVFLTRISLINIVFMTINACFTALLQVMEDFIVPSILGIFFNLPIILYVVIFKPYDIAGLTIATVLGNLLRILVQIPSLLKHKYEFNFTYINLRDSRIRRILYLILPVVIGAGVNQLNLIIDKAIASGFDQGSISALNYSSRIIMFLNSAIPASIVTVMYPFLSKKISEKDFKSFNDYLIKSIIYILIIMMPIAVFFMSLNNPIITILFRRGQFDDVAVILTSKALLFYSISIPFFAVRDLLNAALFAMMETRITTINGVIGMIINIILSIILSKFMGLGGIALASSIASIFICFGLISSINKRIYRFDGKRLVYSSKYILTASFTMFIVISIMNYFFIKSINNIIYVVITALISFGFYLVYIRISKLEESQELWSYLSRKFIK